MAAAGGAGPAAAANTPLVPGYWLAASDGGIYNYNAPDYGSVRGVPLARPVVGSAAHPDGLGYWMVASDGGVFSFGSAKFFGSTGNIALNKPIVGMAPTSDGGGYWLVASDGGIFAFGDAKFFGSTGNIALNKPIVGMAPTSDGGGYWLAASDGGIFTFGDAPFYGSAGSARSPAPITAMITTTHGSTQTPVAGSAQGPGSASLPPAGATGYDVSRWQCGNLPAPRSFAVVQVSGGSINGAPNPCYTDEAQWAGPQLMAYVFLDGLPSTPPPEAQSGPGGTCAGGDVTCEAYNFGYYWASHWVSYASGVGHEPGFWWLDVEAGHWSANVASNDGVIRGAVDGLRSTGVSLGIYSTAYQWGQIAGSLSFPGMPLWVPGADNVSGDAQSAANFCTSSSRSFAGGNVGMVQYGYNSSGGPATYDPDYACV